MPTKENRIGEKMLEFLNSTISVKEAIIISVIISVLYFISTFVVFYCVEHYDKYRKRKKEKIKCLKQTYHQILHGNGK